MVTTSYGAAMALAMAGSGDESYLDKESYQLRHILSLWESDIMPLDTG